MPASTPPPLSLGEEFRLNLSLEILRRGAIRLTAWGTSMLPSIWPGDMLIIEPAKHNEIVRGDIVLVLRNSRVFIHRVIEIQESNERQIWITRGDSMPQSDPPATAPELPGRVVRISREDRSFEPGRRISGVDRVLAWVFCRSDRVRSLALRIHAARLRITRPKTDSRRRIDLAEDANGTPCLPHISQSFASHG